MAYKLYTLPKVIINTAGVAQALTSNDALAASSLIVTAASSNVGKVYIGGDTVNSDDGEGLEPGDSLTIAADTLRGTNHEILLATVFADTDTNGNIVTVQYLKLK